MLVAIGFYPLFHSCTYSKQQNIRSALYAALLFSLCFLNFACYPEQELRIRDSMKVKELEGTSL